MASNIIIEDFPGEGEFPSAWIEGEQSLRGGVFKKKQESLFSGRIWIEHCQFDNRSALQ